MLSFLDASSPQLLPFRSMPFQHLSLDFAPPIAIITLTQPESGNRVGRALLEELSTAVETATARQDVRAAILTNSGSNFSAGWDDAVVREIETQGTDAARSTLLGGTFQFLVNASVPIIAAINGDAISAGLELALACDLRLASTQARFGFPDVSDGRIPMAGGTQRLSRIVGYPRAVELVLTGRILTSAEALEWGMLNAVYEAEVVLSSAADLAKTLSERGPLAVGLAKEAIYRGADMPLQEALRYETDLTILLQTTSDRAEGVQAFIEKRQPRFQGR
jgi:enoyl-CoA hydratase